MGHLKHFLFFADCAEDPKRGNVFKMEPHTTHYLNLKPNLKWKLLICSLLLLSVAVSSFRSGHVLAETSVIIVVFT